MHVISGPDWKRTWYISGPMSGYENYNFETFQNVSAYLRALGFKIISPHECEPEPEGTPGNIVWERMMVKCFKAMEECQGIILLQGWPESRGAMQELEYAIAHKWPVYFLHDETKILVRMSKAEVVQDG